MRKRSSYSQRPRLLPYTPLQRPGGAGAEPSHRQTDSRKILSTPCLTVCGFECPRSSSEARAVLTFPSGWSSPGDTRRR